MAVGSLGGGGPTTGSSARAKDALETALANTTAAAQNLRIDCPLGSPATEPNVPHRVHVLGPPCWLPGGWTRQEASAAVMTATSAKSWAEQPRETSFTGLRSPWRMGPIAAAPPRRSVIL